MQRFPVVLFVLTVLVFALPARASVTDAQNAGSWLDGFTLVVVDTDTPEGLHAARKEIQARGGRVAIMSLPSTILGWVPFEVRSELIGVAGIQWAKAPPGLGVTPKSENRPAAASAAPAPAPKVPAAPAAASPVATASP